MKKWILPVVALGMSVAVANVFAQAPAAKDAPRTGADKATTAAPKQDTGTSAPGVGAPGTQVEPKAKAAKKGGADTMGSGAAASSSATGSGAAASTGGAMDDKKGRRARRASKG